MIEKSGRYTRSSHKVGLRGVLGVVGLVPSNDISYITSILNDFLNMQLSMISTFDQETLPFHTFKGTPHYYSSLQITNIYSRTC